VSGDRIARRLLLSLVFAVAAGGAGAQTPRAVESIAKGGAGDDEGGERAGIESVAPTSRWVGAQIGYMFGGTNEFADNLLATGQLVFDVDMGEKPLFRLPIMGNISQLSVDTGSASDPEEQLDQQLQELLTSTRGVHIGLYPYRHLLSREVLQLTAYGTLGYKVNAFRDSSDTVTYLQQGRFAVGLETTLGRRDGFGTVTLGATAVATVMSRDTYANVFGDEKSVLASGEFTGVVPIREPLGFMVETILSEGGHGSFRAGIVIAAGTDGDG